MIVAVTLIGLPAVNEPTATDELAPGNLTWKVALDVAPGAPETDGVKTAVQVSSPSGAKKIGSPAPAPVKLVRFLVEKIWSAGVPS